MVVGLLGNKSPDSNRLTLVTPKSENDVRLQAKLGNQNPTGLPVRIVRMLRRFSMTGTVISIMKRIPLQKEKHLIVSNVESVNISAHSI